LCRAVFPLGLFCFVFYCASRFSASFCFVSSLTVPRGFSAWSVLFCL
jgi:hypothetical protein